MKKIPNFKKQVKFYFSSPSSKYSLSQLFLDVSWYIRMLAEISPAALHRKTAVLHEIPSPNTG